MGRLGNILQTLKERKKRGAYTSGSIFGHEMMFSADFILIQSQDELYVAKNRYGEPRFFKLHEIIGTIVGLYLSGDMTETLSPSAMFNVLIKEDLEKAINDVLVKHKLLKE